MMEEQIESESPLMSKEPYADSDMESALTTQEAEKSKKSKLKRIAIALTILSSIWLCVWIWYLSSSKHHMSLVSLGNCGPTSESAREKGCIFDIMMSTWMPPACYNRELSENFLTANNWTYYTDREATSVVPESVVREGDYKVLYLRGDFHYQHCLYLWAKQMKAMETRPLILDNVARDAEHIGHCMRLLGTHNLTRILSDTGTAIHRNHHIHECFVG